MTPIPIDKAIHSTLLCIKALEYLNIIKKEETFQRLDKDLKAGVNTMKHIAKSKSAAALARYINDAYHSFNRAVVSIQNGLVKHEKEKVWTYLGLAYCHTAFGDIENAKESLREILDIEVEDNPLARVRSDVIADSYAIPEQAVEAADKELQFQNRQEALFYGVNATKNVATATTKFVGRAIEGRDSPTTKQYNRRVRELENLKTRVRNVISVLESGR